MSATIPPNRVRDYRLERGWTQAQLAQKSGVSRAAVSAIEMLRLVPSVAAALGLARALECTVEELFGGSEADDRQLNWAWPVERTPCRFWRAEIDGQRWLYPADATSLLTLPHDGVAGAGFIQSERRDRSSETLVIASCDPAAALLANEYSLRTGWRLLVLVRSSSEALKLLGSGVVHAAGVHLAKSRSRTGNARQVRQQLGRGYSLLQVAKWDAGLAIGRGHRVGSIREALQQPLRWVGREPGSGARQCQDELLTEGPAPTLMARDHRGVAEAIRLGWADAGICLRLTAEEAGLQFLSVRQESYDIVFRTTAEADPRVRGLIDVVRSEHFRRLLAELPGYDTSGTGELVVDGQDSR